MRRRMRITPAQESEIRRLVEVEGLSLYNAHARLLDPKPGYSTFNRHFPDLNRPKVPPEVKRLLLFLSETEEQIESLRTDLARREDLALEHNLLLPWEGIDVALSHARYWVDDAIKSLRVDNAIPDRVKFIRRSCGRPALAHVEKAA